MYEDSEFLVIRTNKGHRKGYPFSSFQNAVIRAIKVVEECSVNEIFSKATVETGIWNGDEFDDSVDITECRDTFDYVLQNTDVVASVFEFGGIASGKYFNSSAAAISDPKRVPEENAIYVEGDDVIDMGTDWRTYAVYLSWRLTIDEINIEEVCDTLGAKRPNQV